MSDLMTISVALSALNLILAAVVLVVYLRNHAQIRSRFTLALLVFALFLVVHNGLQIYHQVTMMATFTPQAEMFLLGENALQAAALAMLAWATLR
ncbi:MAG: hypothetical protein ABR562_01015 [Thermoplasmatota archaeon]